MEVGWAGWIRVTTGYKPYHHDMVEANNPFRLDNTSILCIYKVFKHLMMQWVAVWMHPYFIKTMEVCQAGWTWVTTGYNPYQYDIVEARNHFRLNCTSILYIYKCLKHLLMLWMAIWMHPYFIKPMEVCQACWTWVTIEYKPYQHDIVEARNHFRLNYTSILYIYQVFKHILMHWMAIWMHP